MSLVEVPVVVTDRDGRIVPDLTKADFEVEERGVPQTIIAFERVSIPVAEAAPEAPRPSPPAPADVSTNEGVGSGRIFVLVLDGLHVSPGSIPAVRRAARQFVERHVGPDDLAAVLSPGATDAATQDFTGDKARLLAAIDGFSGTKLRSATLELDEERRLAGPTGTPAHGGRDPSDAERADRAQSLSSVLERLAGHLARVERRRKALLLFSEGVDYNLADAMGAVQQRGSSVLAAARRAVGALMRADVSVYAIDPRGLDWAGSTTERLPAHSSPNEPRADGSIPRMDFSEPSLRDEYRDSIASLRNVAESTGGFAAVDANDPAPAFARIVRETSDYYVIGYAPASPGKPGQFQPIRVRVRRPGVSVVARSGYTVPAGPQREAATAPAAPPPAGPMTASPFGARPRAGGIQPLTLDPEAAPAPETPKGLTSDMAALLSSSLPLAGLPLRVQAAPFRAGGRKQLVQLVIEVLGSSVSFSERGGRFESRLVIASFTVDSSGRGANGRSATIDLRLTAEELQRVRATGVRWMSQIELSSGRHRLRVAVREPATGAAGVVTADVDVPSYDGSPSLSGVLLTSLPSVLMVTRGEARLASALGTPPTAQRRFVAGDRIVAAAEAYGPAPGPVAAEVERAEDGVVLHRLEARPTGSGRPGLSEISLPIDTATMPPGRYVLRLRLDGASSGSPGERFVPFEVVASPSR